MRKFIYISLFVLLMSSIFYAQSTKRSKNVRCPKIEITNPPTNFKAGDLATYSVNLTGNFDKEKVKYNWEVTNATSVNGQGTPTLKIITLAGKNLDSTKVRLNISGLKKGCQSNYVAKSVGKPLSISKPILIDKFGRLTDEKIGLKIDELIKKAKEYPEATFYLLTYGNPKEISEREKMFDYYFNLRDFETSKIVFVRGGKSRIIRTRFWLTPKGADPSVIN